MIKKINVLFSSILFALLTLGYASAQQINIPSASPSSKIEQTVGLTDISVEYSRPSMKGRTVFGDLVPYGELWRTGANMATKITFSDDVKVEGKEVKAGTYALFSIPGANEWTLILNSNPNQGGTGSYDESLDVLRVNVKPESMDGAVETFVIDINDITMTSAKFWLIWEKTAVPLSVEVDVDSKVMADIERAMDPRNEAGKYYAAASYYFDSGKDISKAAEWINKSVELGNDRYWVRHLQARILEKKGDKKEAIKAAQASIELAKEAGNNQYVQMNEELIARCK